MKSHVLRIACLLALVSTLITACAQPTAPTTAPATSAPATEATKAPEPTSAPTEPTQAPEPTVAPPPAQPAEFHGAFPYQVPPTGHLNTFVTNGIPNGLGIYYDLMEMPFAMYNWADGSWTYYLAENSEVKNGDTLIIHLRPGVVWSDGNPLTAQDVVDTFNVGRLFKWSVFNFVDTITAVDDATVEFHMFEPSTTVQRYVLKERIRSGATYGAIAAKVADLVAAGADQESEEWKAVLKEATDYRPEQLIVSGPYNLDMSSITEAQLTLVKVPTAWDADQVKFDKIVLYNGETPTVSPLVLAGDVDYATHGFPPATEKAFIDQGTRIIRAPTYTGPAIFFNNDVYPLNKREVRQAMAYVIKRDENGYVSLGDSGVAVKYMIGFSDNLAPLWISQDQLATYNTYDYDTAKAEELLTGIGFTRGADNVWLDDTGKPLEFELTVPAEYADWSAAAENAAQQLNAFGFKITVRGVQFQQHTQDIPAGNFVMAIRGWGAANPHPYFSYVTDLFVNNYIQSTTGKGMNFPMEQTLSDGSQVDLQELINNSVASMDEEAQKERIATVAKVFNDLLPIVPLWERYGNNPALETRVAGWPPDGAPQYQNAVYGDNFVTMMILDGTLGPK